MSNSQLVSTAGVGDEIARAIGLFMGRGRKFSVNDVAIMSGIEARTLQSYIASNEERRTPPHENLFLLMQVFGTQFTSKILSFIGQGAHSLNPQPGDPAVVIATLAHGVAQFASLGADGSFDGDHCKLEPIAGLIADTVAPWLPRGR